MGTFSALARCVTGNRVRASGSLGEGERESERVKGLERDMRGADRQKREEKRRKREAREVREEQEAKERTVPRRHS